MLPGIHITLHTARLGLSLGFAFAVTWLTLLASVDRASAATITVTTTADEYLSGAACSLREAVKSANTNADTGSCSHSGAYGDDLILLPPGTYNLTIVGLDEDLDATSDLDIVGTVTISATGSTPTIRGGAGYSGRLIQVLAGGKATIKRVTLGLGTVPNGRAGGCIRVEAGGALTLDSTTVSNCNADGNAGGILNIGTMHISNTNILTNTAAGATGGGGIFNDNGATLFITNTRFLGNSATQNDAGGGAIFCDATSRLSIADSTIEQNTADYGPGVRCVSANSAIVRRSTVRQNTGEYSGGLDIRANQVLIEDTLIANNRVFNGSLPGDLFGGGAALQSSNSRILHSIIRDNELVDDASCTLVCSTLQGGGVFIAGGTTVISESTISNNSISGSAIIEFFEGGGGVAAGAGASVRILNSTISANSVAGGGFTAPGGGIVVGNENVAAAQSRVSLHNVTIFGNSGDDGGGLHALFTSDLITITNSVIAGNTDVGVGTTDDCGGAPIDFISFSHVQNTTGCTFDTGAPTTGASGLGALANNGGTTAGDTGSAEVPKTHRPSGGSILVDAGDPTGCDDGAGSALEEDQRGFARPSGPTAGPERCDVGAVELHFPAHEIAKVAARFAISPSIAAGSVAYTVTAKNTDVLTAANLIVTDTLPVFMQWDIFPGGCVNHPANVLVCKFLEPISPGETHTITAKASFVGVLAPGGCGTDFVNTAAATEEFTDGTSQVGTRSVTASTRYMCLQPVFLPGTMRSATSGW